MLAMYAAGGRNKDLERKKFWAQKNTLTTSEKELIAYYELQWGLRQYIPTIEEVAKYLKLTQVTVNYYLQRSQVVKALDKRGIPWRQHSQEQLTATQIAVATTMMNFADERPNKEKLDQLGINSETYNAWLKDPQFKNFIDNLADQNLRNVRPVAVTEFTKKIQGGDWNAIKYFLDVTGEVSSNEAPQSEVLLRVIIEILQEEVKDQDTLLRIAIRLKAATANRTLEPAIPGEVIENDPELEQARRMLGI